MKTSELQSAVKKLKKVISKTNTLPILDYLLNDNGTLMASDLETYHIIGVGFPGKFLIDATEFSKILDKLPKDSDINVTSDDLLNIKIDIEGMGTFSLIGADFEEYPAKPEVRIAIGEFSPEDIALIKRAVKFTDNNELRPVMNAVYVEDKIVGSDAHRLVYYAYEKKLTKPVLIPKKAIGILSATTYTAYISKDDKWLSLEGEEESIIIRLVDGKYPAYNSVIPQANHLEYYVDNKLLQATIKLASIAANQASELIRFNFKDSKLTVSAQDIDYSRSFTRTIPLKYSSNEEEFEARFKAAFMLDMLGDAGDVVKFAFSTPDRAVLIDSDKLLMPMMINH